MNYAPNGLGQATQVVDSLGGISYATGVTYHPNGEIAGFTYGNGIVHTMVQTPVRGLPGTYTDGTIVKDSYGWDENGNLTSLTETRSPVLQTRTRTMSYDERDRLWTTTYGYKGRVYQQMLQRVIDRGLSAELDAHLGYERHEKAVDGARANTRNGVTKKRLKGAFDEVQVTTPRDRMGSFDPQLVKKQQTRLGDFEEKILALYARRRARATSRARWWTCTV